MTKRWITYITALVLSAVFYAIHDGYISFFVLISVLLFPLLSLLISLPHMLTACAEFAPLPSEINVGSKFEVFIKLNSSLKLPIPKATIKYFARNITIDHDSNAQKLSVFGCNDKPLPFPVTSEHVGCIYINIISIKVFDYLGMFNRSIKTPQARKVYVLPHPIIPKPHPTIPNNMSDGKGLRPKPGGGFAENYDLREYRIGDPLNSIHWKLSSKLDQLIVREPLISDKGKIFICLNLFGTPNELDSIFAQLAYIARLLLARMNEFYICYYDSKANKVISFIEEENDYQQVMTNILSQQIKITGKPVDKAIWKQSDWFYVIRPAFPEKNNVTEEELA